MNHLYDQDYTEAQRDKKLEQYKKQFKYVQ